MTAGSARPTSSSAAERLLDGLPAELLVVGGAVSVQFGAGLATELLRQYGPLPVVAMRIVFGMLLVVLARPPRLRGVSRDALLSCVALGVVLMTMNTAFYIALSRIPLGVAVTIEFWGPLTVAVIGSRRALDLVWVVLAAIGIYALAGGRITSDDAVGVAAVFVAGGCWALYILVGGRMARDWPDGRGLGLAMIVASLMVAPVSLAFGDFRPLLTAPLAIAAGLVVALFSSALPYTFEMAALRRLSPATFGVLMSLEPAIATMAGFLLLGQTLDPLDLLAIGCVAVASAGSSLSARRLRVAAGELESG